MCMSMGCIERCLMVVRNLNIKLKKMKFIRLEGMNVYIVGYIMQYDVYSFDLLIFIYI